MLTFTNRQICSGNHFWGSCPQNFGHFWVFWANLGHLTMPGYKNRDLAIFYQCSHFLIDNFVIGTIFEAVALRFGGILRGLGGTSWSFTYG